MPYSAAIIKVWLDKTFVILIAVCLETNDLTRLSTPIPEDTFFSYFMNEGLPRETFINNKLERFALVYWETVYMNIHRVVI